MARRNVDAAVFKATFMVMKVTNIANLKNHLSDYLSEVANGEEIVICKRNVPVARITGLTSKRNRTEPGCGIGTGEILGCVDEPLIPEGDWKMLEKPAP